MGYNVMNYPQKYIDRFWNKVLIKYKENGDPDFDQCMEWIGGKFDFGYGKFKLFKTHVRSHRFSYEFYNGPIPEGILVCHSCDNPPCVNPTHLWLGTHQDNDQDKVMKGRSTKGIKNATSKLTEGQVLEIINLSSIYTEEQIANMFGVASTIINRIKNGKNWTHITNIIDTGPKMIRLTEVQVREIKKRVITETCVKIAKDFGVNAKTINNIKNRNTWRHIT